jgi:predicted dinucleotide-binding enzyme
MQTKIIEINQYQHIEIGPPKAFNTITQLTLHDDDSKQGHASRITLDIDDKTALEIIKALCKNHDLDQVVYF